MRSLTARRILSNSILLLIIASSFLFYAYSEGITGKTKKNGIGCDCHSPSPTSGVTVTITGPDQLLVNETANYSVTISGGPLVRAGTNIAASAGTLTPGDGMRKENNEITHVLPKAPAGGVVTFQFTYTAPATEGNQTIYANGNSVNNNGQNNGDQWNFAPNKVITVTSATSVNDENIVNTYKLNQNYPNPFNPVTNISYSVAESGNIKLTLYDVTGNEVETLVDGFKSAGSYSINFNAANLPSGVYLYRLITNNFVDVKKMVLQK